MVARVHPYKPSSKGNSEVDGSSSNNIDRWEQQLVRDGSEHW